MPTYRDYAVPAPPEEICARLDARAERGGWLTLSEPGREFRGSWGAGRVDLRIRGSKLPLTLVAKLDRVGSETRVRVRVALHPFLPGVMILVVLALAGAWLRWGSDQGAWLFLATLLVLLYHGGVWYRAAAETERLIRFFEETIGA
jgi:hypothetical protein